MRFPRIGMRIIKTMIAVFLSISVFLILLLIDKARGKELGNVDDTTALYNMYTPFFAGIAAAYTLHRDKKSSYQQAKIRSLGSIIGGIVGMFVIMIVEYIFKTVLHIDETNFVLYKLIEFTIVSIGIVPLICIAVALKQNTAVFISCLTYLSVTISIRNGGMAIWLFASNRILSTLIGIGIALLVSNFALFRRKNKDILFVSSLDNNFLTQGNMNPYIKYKLNNLYYKDMPLIFATTRTMSTLKNVFDDVDVDIPMVVMNGAAIYHLNKDEYEYVNKIDDVAKKVIEKELLNYDMNAFRYIIDDNMLHCYYKQIKNDGEKAYYNQGRKNRFDNFVKADLLDELDIALYIIIDKKDKIDNLYNTLYNSDNSDKYDLITYHFDEIEGDYWYLKINSKGSRKENQINKIKEVNNFNKTIVCGSGKTDIKLIEESYFSICLEKAPEYIKEKVDLIVDDSEQVLKIFDKIYQNRNIDRTINKIKNKYKKNRKD